MATTVATDIGRIRGHIVPLVGNMRVRDVTKSEIITAMNDISRGKTRAVRRTGKPRGKSVLTGGSGTASRAVGVFAGILTYAVDCGIIEVNPAHGIRKPRDRVRDRRLDEREYRILGQMLDAAAKHEQFRMTVNIIRLLAMTGCRRSEIINLMWSDVDLNDTCLRLSNSKEGKSVRPIGLTVVEVFERAFADRRSRFVFPGPRGDDAAFGGFPSQWGKIFRPSPLACITPHVLRHSFASSRSKPFQD